jgi:hypothetical protein
MLCAIFLVTCLSVPEMATLPIPSFQLGLGLALHMGEPLFKLTNNSCVPVLPLLSIAKASRSAKPASNQVALSWASALMSRLCGELNFQKDAY